MPATYTFGITGGATGSIIVNSVSLSHTSSKQELQGPTGNIAAVGYNKFKTEVSISGVGDAGSLAVGGALGSMPGISSGTYTIDSISTSRSIDGFAEFEITATKN
jgi:hypothetical protein